MMVPIEQEIVSNKKSHCDKSLSDLNAKVVFLKTDLQTKLQFSEQRTLEKQAMLTIFPKNSIHGQVQESDTKMKLQQVIVKEQAIQHDLRACIEKL